MSRPILITGASGFLGKHLVEQLRAQRAGTLRILNYGPCPWEPAADLEILEGDITRSEDVDRAMEGCGEVYHLAGVVSRDPSDKTKLYDIHVGGCRNVCEAATRHRPRRAVVVSTSGTVAVSPEPRLWKESDGYRDELPSHWHYYLSKIEAERLVLEYARRHALPVVVANPALLLGPGDDLGSSTNDVALFLKGQVMAVPRGGMCFVDARDAAAGLIAAMRSGRTGERYLLGGANWTFRQFLDSLGEITGIRPPRLEPPPWLSLWSGRVLRKLMPLAGRQFPMDDVTVEMSAWYWFVDSSKAVDELGFRARDPMETLRDTVNYIRARGV